MVKIQKEKKREKSCQHGALWGHGTAGTPMQGREQEETVTWHSHCKRHEQFLLGMNVQLSYDPATPWLDVPKGDERSAHQSLVPESFLTAKAWRRPSANQLADKV